MTISMKRYCVGWVKPYTTRPRKKSRKSAEEPLNCPICRGVMRYSQLGKKLKGYCHHELRSRARPFWTGWHDNASQVVEEWNQKVREYGRTENAERNCND